MSVYITGDTHRDFARIEGFCGRQDTTKDDILVILGDAGINFSGAEKDRPLKEALAQLPITLFCVHGNHEMRPESVGIYSLKEWHRGMVYAEDDWPNLLFARDGEIYELNGYRCLVLGGAYSVDKPYRLRFGFPWFPDEQPSEDIKSRVEARLEKEGWDTDVVFSHTVPYKYVPWEIFGENFDPTRIDTSTEQWLDRIEERLSYSQWFAGHYHMERSVGKLRICFEDIRELL